MDLGKTKNMVTQYWLGPPCKYHDERTDLDGFPEGDLGGREISLPEELTPQKFYSTTMPMLNMIQTQAMRDSVRTGRQLHPFGILAQGIQLVWVFASIQTTRLYNMLVKNQSEVAELQRRVVQLEALLQKETGKAPDA